MRITNTMMQNRVVFNMQRSVSRFMDMQVKMSSGRRINQPSDDPTGTLQDLSYRSELTKIEQYRKNVDKGLSRMGMYDSAIADMKNSVSTAREIAVAMSNGTYDYVAREAEANEVQSLFDQLIHMGNVEFDGSKMFAGFNTDTVPFEVTALGVVYRGDQGKINYEVESGLRMAVNYTGSETLMAPTENLGAESDLNIALTGATLLADIDQGAGIDLATGTFTLEDKNLNITATIDLTAAPAVITVSDLINRINADLAANVPPITNVTASISGAGNSILFTTVETGLISDFTALSNLNGGNGVDLDPGKIIISDGAGINEIVDLTGLTTIDQVRTAFNNAMAASANPAMANVTMSINAAGTGLQIDDANGVPLGLTIADANPQGRVTTDLGLVGYIGAQLIGDDLNPRVSFEIAETTGTTAADLGILGSFTSDFDGTDLDPSMKVDSLLSDMNTGSGYERGEIRFAHGDTYLTIDLSDPAIVTVQDMLDAVNNSGLSLTAQINTSGRGIEIINDDINRTLIIDDLGDGNSSKQMGLFGGGDVLGTMMLLQSTLRDNDQDGCGRLLSNLDSALQRLIECRGTVGSQAVRLENTATRLLDQTLDFTSRLSQVEDADFSSLITELSTHENIYQAALLASAKIIQPSLMDFLR